MPRYTVQFALPSGRTGVELVDAANERAAASRIEADGRTPITIHSADGNDAAKSTKMVPRQRGGKKMRRAVLDFTHQLAAVTESGIPVIAGLKAVGEQTDHVRLRAAISRIAGRIEGGRAMAEAMEPESDIFPALFVKTLAAGEAAGNIPEVLNSLARYQEQEQETRAQIRSALTYPALVVGALVLATIFMLTFVVPQFAAMFDKFNGQLPLPTRILLAISHAMTDHYILLTLGLFGAGFGIKTLFRYKGARAWLDAQLLKLPVFGSLLVGVYMMRFIDLLALLTRSALPITQSLRVTADSMTNDAIRCDIRGMVHSIEGGRTLAEAFGETKTLTPLVKRMLAIGETAGRTDQILAYVAEYYSTQTKRSIKLLSTLIEPVLVTGLAAVVLFFALAIFLPMWKILKLVGSA